MSGRAAAGVDNTTRRKWDKEEYAAKAAERQRAEDSAVVDAKRAKVADTLGIVVRKALNQDDMIQRDYVSELRSRVGTRTLVTVDNPNAAGFHCKATGRTLRDSLSYLDHINGKRQQRALGMSMRVERSTLEDVQSRFEEAKRRKEEEPKPAQTLEARAREAEAEEERLRAERKERKAEKKKREREGAGGEDEGGGVDPEFAALMGFSGFK